MDFWQLLLLAVGMTTTLVGAYWGMARALLTQAQQNIDEKFQAISVGLSKQDDQSRRIERDLMELRAQLPREYVRAENYIPQQAQLLTKMDQVNLRMEAFFRQCLKGASVE